MTEIVFRHNGDELLEGVTGSIPVLMYGRRPPRAGTASIGGPVFAAVRRLGGPVHRTGFDLLTVAMAVTAADTFVDRRLSTDGWAREFRLKIPLADPAPWGAVRADLENALRFLSGDLWELEFLDGGPDRPPPQSKGRLTSLGGHDCACLFSGGLDSTIGVLDLMAAGKRPVLISHSYARDADRQRLVSDRLPDRVARFAAVANPASKLDDPNDVQMRTRSFNFLAYGTLVAATMAGLGVVTAPTELHVPENGLIALNPPLTPRRIGALSTRTTHPHFLELFQRVLTGLGIPVHIVTDPYRHMTKGAMLAGCRDSATLLEVAGHTVSCGKWKRTGMQCGRCVPCLIRRAAFHAAAITDPTNYAPEGQDLRTVMANEDGKIRDDLLAMILAARRLSDVDVKRWVSQSGPLPTDREARDNLFGVARDGMAEVRTYLDHSGLLQ